jgi:hypothetical protein
MSAKSAFLPIGVFSGPSIRGPRTSGGHRQHWFFCHNDFFLGDGRNAVEH